MMKRAIYLVSTGLLLMMLFHSCAAVLPQPPTADPVPLILPPTALETNSPAVEALQHTVVPTGRFVLLPYPPLVMDYDPEQWTDQSEYTNVQVLQNYLQSTNLTSCRLFAVGPSGFYPTPDEVITLGAIRYEIYTSVETPPELVTRSFFENKTLTGFDYDLGIPVLALQAVPDEWDQCLSSAADVLASLHIPEY